MFTDKQLVRNAAFGVFCAMILFISCSLTYYVSFYDEEKHIVANLEIKQDENDICGNQPNFIIGTFFFKIMAAFFAGGVLSDRLFIKMGII